MLLENMFKGWLLGCFLICPYIAVLHFASSAMTAGYYLTHYPTCYFRERPLQLSGYLRNKFFSCLYDLTRKNINVVYLDDNLSGPTNSVIVRPALSPFTECHVWPNSLEISDLYVQKSPHDSHFLFPASFNPQLRAFLCANAMASPQINCSESKSFPTFVSWWNWRLF